jgi:colanic acid biosynthesis glycosyl transferase WcaI
MRILYLTQYFYPEIGATQTRAYEMASGLARAGHQVTILTEVPNHPQGIIHPAYRGHLWVRERMEDIQVLRVWVKASSIKNPAARICFYLTYMLNATLAGLCLATERYDLIYATSPPLLVGAAGLALSLLRRLPFVFEVRDLWPESAIELGEINRPAAVRLAQAIADLCYRRAARTVAVTQGIYDRLQQKGIGPERLALIPNGANTDLYRPGPRDASICKRLGLEGKFVLIYAGLHGLIHGTESIIECARLLQQYKDILFILIGEGVRKMHLMSLAQEYALDNILFLPAQPECDLPRYLSCADAGLATTKRLPLCEGTIPVKMFSYMACGLPVILAVRGEARQILERAGAGIAVEPEDPAQLCEAILRLKADPEFRRECGRRGREFVLENYDRKAMARRLEELLQAVKQRGMPGGQNGGHCP